MAMPSRTSKSPAPETHPLPIPTDAPHGSDSESDDESLLPSSRPSRPRSSSLTKQARSPRAITTLLLTMIFILAFGGGLMAVPCLRIFEQILCHYHYNDLKGDSHIGYDEHIDESMCKGTEVQEKLNILLAGLWFISTIPALMTTIPYGLLADRIGRRPVFALSLLGMILGGCYNFTIMTFWKVLPLQMIWASPIFILIGGGEAVSTMMFYAIGNDITTDANRANIFLLGGCGGLVAELIAPSLASALMARSPWIPIMLGLALLVFGTGLIVFIPETIKLASAEFGPDTTANTNPSAPKSDDSFYSAVKTKVSDSLGRVHGATKILHSLPVVLLLVSFIIGPYGRVSGDLSMRYISNRYHWQLRQAGFLLSLGAFVNILLLIAILPLLSHYLISRLSFSSNAKDLILAQGSVLLLILGAGLMGAAPTVGLGISAMIIWTLGTGFTALTRSLITTLVDQQYVGRLYSAIAVIEISCAMTAGPIQSALYAVGLKWKGTWQGLPFFSLAFISLVAGIAVWTFSFLMRKDINQGDIRLRDEEGEEDVALETEDEDGRRVGVV